MKFNKNKKNKKIFSFKSAREISQYDNPSENSLKKNIKIDTASSKNTLISSSSAEENINSIDNNSSFNLM